VLPECEISMVARNMSWVETQSITRNVDPA
jgi:hypothetical protein